MKLIFKSIVLPLCLSFAYSLLFAKVCIARGPHSVQPQRLENSLETWMKRQHQEAHAGVERALVAGRAGVVIASPSIGTPPEAEPNYLFHWTRDAALTLDLIVTQYQNAKNAQDRAKYQHYLKDYFLLAREQQRLPNRSGAGDGRGLGEPKFYINGIAINEDWGRPQNDGPALRALVGIRWAWALLSEEQEAGQESYVRTVLYDSMLPTNSVIKVDLEYVSHVWNEPCIDLWEESFGEHFYTLLVMRQALVEGSLLATTLGDPGAARWYSAQATQLEHKLSQYLAGSKIETVLPRQKFHESGLDISVLLGALHARGIKTKPWLRLDHPKLIKTVELLQNSFQSLYSINRTTSGRDSDGSLGTTFGRYPEDEYDGVQTGKQGNPWVLATAAVAEWYYLRGDREMGDRYMRRLRYHARPDGSLYEQMDRTHGFMRGARDLTWSFVSFVTAYEAR